MITIDYSTYIINVPKLYTQFVSTDPQTGLEVRSMDIVQFAKDLYDVQDNPEGAWATTAYEYTAPKDVGGVQLAPVVLILSPYIITFEDGQYAVNLAGANSNIADVSNVNQVSIRSFNSAGLITVTTGSGVTAQDKLDIADQVWDELLADHDTADTFGEKVQESPTATVSESDKNDIADAVWDEATSGHISAGSFGKSLADMTSNIAIILGLQHHNYRIKSLVYDANNDLQTATVRIYGNATDTQNDANATGEYAITVTYSAPGVMDSYVVVDNT